MATVEATSAPQDTREEHARRPVGGWKVVAGKEFRDHVGSMRFKIMLGLVGLAGLAAVYAVAGEIRNVADQASEVPALFLRVYTIAPENLPFSYLGLVGLLLPLLGIVFGFDAVNGERSQGTLPRLVSQPIYRDDVINGKFVGGLGVIAIMLALLTLFVGSVSILRLGIIPSGAEVARIASFWVVSVIYGGFWLAISMLFSVVLSRATTSALAAIAAWLVLTVFAGAITGIIADNVARVPEEPTPQEELANQRLRLTISRVSPATLYGEASIVLLNPEQRALGILFIYQLDRALPTELSLDQSFLVAWPQVIGMFAATAICFAGAYISFMRQEVRA